MALVPSVTVLLEVVCRNFKTRPPVNYQDFKARTSEVTIDSFLNHMHRSGHSAMCGPENVATFTCARDHPNLGAAGPSTRMLRCNTETTLQFPDSQSALLKELKYKNKVLSGQWLDHGARCDHTGTNVRIYAVIGRGEGKECRCTGGGVGYS